MSRDDATFAHEQLECSEMVIWQGLGILVLLETLVALVGIHQLGLSDRIEYLVSGIVAAAAIWFSGRWLNDPAKDRMLVDPKTGERVRLVSSHTLFWVPMQWWAIPVFLMGALIAYGR